MRTPLLVLFGACALMAGGRPPVPAACDDISVPRLRCSTVTVVENRTTGRGRTIGLRVVVLPARAKDAAADPVFILAGGPGQAATDLVRDPEILSHPLGARRDLVFLDQRGTGGSNSLLCPFYPPDDYARGQFADFMPIDRVRACRTALERTTDLGQYTTAASVADLDDVRKALGYEQINLSGGSYGTRLAMEYVRTHGRHVRSVILDGPVPPSLRMPDGFGRSAQGALDALLDECLAQPACAKAFPDIRTESRAVFARLAKEPITTRLNGVAADVTMTRDNVAEALRYMTYSSRNASRVPRLLHLANGGDFRGFAEFLRRYRRPETFDALYLSITCAEDVPFVPKNSAALDEPTYLGGYRVRQQQAACAAWPRGGVPAWHGEPVRSNVPVLLTTGLLDPVTPPAGGDLIARTLPNSLHLKVPSGAHTLAGLRGVECLGSIKQQFVERASVSRLDTSCVPRITRTGFEL